MPGCAQCLKRHQELCLVDCRQLRVENRCQYVELKRSEIDLCFVVFGNQVVDNIRVDAHKAAFLNFVFEQPHEMAVELSVHQQHIVAPLVGRINIGVLSCRVGCIETHDVTLFVGLRRLDKRFILIDCEIFPLSVFEQTEFHGAVAEFFVGEHAILDEDLDVVPLLLEVGTVVAENLVETAGHLLGDI